MTGLLFKVISAVAFLIFAHALKITENCSLNTIKVFDNQLV